MRPPQISRRNLTLPSIVTQNLLTVPNESDVRIIDSRKINKLKLRSFKIIEVPVDFGAVHHRPGTRFLHYFTPKFNLTLGGTLEFLVNLNPL